MVDLDKLTEQEQASYSGYVLFYCNDKRAIDSVEAAAQAAYEKAGGQALIRLKDPE